MNIQEKKLENAQMELTIEVDAENVNQEYEAAVEKIQKSVKIDGFRKGKVPLNLVETKFKGHVDQEVIEGLVQRYFFEAVSEKKVTPIAQPDYKFDTVSKDEPFTFTATFDVSPAVTLGKYKEIAAEEVTCKVTDSDVDTEITNMRERSAKVTKKEDENAIVENGDMAKLSLKRIDDIKPEEVAGRKAQEYAIVVGKSKDEYAMDKHVLGMKINEEKEVTIKYPKNYNFAEVAGQKVTYMVKIMEVSSMELPELDDEFAKKNNFESKDDLVTKTKENMEHYVSSKLRADTKASIMKTIVDNSTFDLPETIIMREMHQIFQKTQQQFGGKFESIEQFSQAMGIQSEAFIQQLRDEALQSIKTTLMLSEIAKSEKLEVSEEKYKEVVANIAKSNNKSIEEIESMIEANNSKSRIESEVQLDMAMDFIYENGKVKQLKPITFQEFLDRQNAHQ